MNGKVRGGTTVEGYEFFRLVVSSARGGASAVPVLGNASENIQILNDEKPSVTATAPSGIEGSTLVFSATLNQRYYLPISIAYTTSDFTAVAGSDYTLTAGTLTFLAGTSGTQTVGVPTLLDFTTEVAQKFNMTYTSGSIKVSPLIKAGTIKAQHT